MKKWIKKNWVSLVAISALCVSIARVEPIEFDNGSMVSFVVGLMGICATIMVASQIMGLRMSESKVKSMLNKESDKLREDSYKSTITALFKIEVRAAVDSSERQEWSHFMKDINLLMSYVADLKEPHKANEVAQILKEAEISFKFYQHLHDDKKECLRNNILALIKLMDDDPTDILMLFNVLHTTE